jgi:hypothetical protein
MQQDAEIQHQFSSLKEHPIHNVSQSSTSDVQISTKLHLTFNGLEQERRIGNVRRIRAFRRAINVSYVT